MYWLRKERWSQNFFTNRELIAKLIRGSSIAPNDTVLDIGAGSGAITNELLKITPRVISIEKDPRLTTHPQDFLTYSLPTNPYKVFANIPFSITGDIIRKLLQSPNPPTDCYLVMQSEAAQKFIVNSKANTLAAILFYPFWDIKIIHKFNRSDFHPQPKVDSVLLHIQPRLKPLIPQHQKNNYYDFVAYTFIHNSYAKFIPLHKWIFSQYPKYPSGAYLKLLSQQRKLHKIHRTRNVKNWNKFA